MNYEAAEAFIFDFLQKNLSPKHHYHSLHHTQDVMKATVKLCEMERLDEKTTTLMKTAALFHDVGFVEQYEKNEPVAAAYAEKWLPDYGYDTNDIAFIQRLILVTDIAKQPVGLHEKIMRDADLDYIGRHDFFSISQRLREELFEFGKSIKLVDWHLIEKDFLEKHIYFTESAYRLRNSGKQENMDEIKSLLQEAGGLSGKIDTRHPEAPPLPDERRHIVQTLQKTSLFRNADEVLLKHVAMMVERLHLSADEPLFRKDDPGESMYIIQEGKLKVHDGGITLAELGPGEYFGEASLIDNSPRTASVSASTDAVILRLGEKDFYSLLVSYPSINRMLMKELINRLRNQNNAIVAEFRNREQKLQELVELRTRQIVEEKKNVELKSQELEKALKDLTETQRLLIHQEKMASLGQLTTGIAHELMNPLNFVNNFSAVSSDLVQELSSLELSAEAMELCTELLDNLKRITQHGERAGNIVRSMAEHSSVFGKEKQLIDLHLLIRDAAGVIINPTTDAVFKDHFDVILELNAEHHRIKAVYSEWFRVLTNLIRNAVWAIEERRNADQNLKGLISIRTYNQDNAVLIAVQDNGIGIPEENLKKIFIPFFTTHPPGNGVGLGLSISHQIVSASGGSIQPGQSVEGACMVISIPLENQQ